MTPTTIDRLRLTIAALVAACSGAAALAGTPCGSPSAGDCCEVQSGPSCSDTACCELVCSFDFYCCDTQWDDICAGEAAAFCDICGGGASCGSVGNDCCSASSTPFCSDADCCNEVCNIDAFCCGVVWDSECATLAHQNCALLCGSCGNSSQPCTKPSPFGEPFCNDETCCNVVCAIDPSCCQTNWDTGCAALATQGCSTDFCGFSPNACCVPSPSGSPGCSNPVCCEVVCMNSSHCCDIEWDAICATLAQQLCGGGCTGLACQGDLNGNGHVDGGDLAILLGAWQTPLADIDGDGTTGGADLAVLLGGWGDCP